MLSGRERRKFERVDARIEVQFRTGNDYVNAYTGNISKGGIYLETSVLPDPNALVELVFQLPTSDSDEAQEPVTIRARIVRLMSISESGRSLHKVGLQFIEVPEEIQIRFDRLYASYALKNS